MSFVAAVQFMLTKPFLVLLLAASFVVPWLVSAEQAFFFVFGYIIGGALILTSNKYEAEYQQFLKKRLGKIKND